MIHLLLIARRVSLSNLRDIQGQNGNWNYDAYMRGLYNGLELAAATMYGRDPIYRDAPKGGYLNGVRAQRGHLGRDRRGQNDADA